MTILYYIGSKLEDYKKARKLRNRLNSLGWTMTYDWTDYLEREKNATVEVYRQAAKNEIEGVTTADVCVFILQGGRGCWAEVGAALATGKIVFIVGKVKREPPVFFYHPNVIRIPRFDPREIARLAKKECKKRLGFNK